MNIIEKYLPSNCYSNNNTDEINGIIVHYFSGRYAFPDDMFNPEKCYDLFVSLNSKDVRGKRYYASAQYMIDRTGIIYKLVPDGKKAWHSGLSEMHGRNNCNKWCIGIEMIASPTSGYTEEQYQSLSDLSKELIDSNPISVNNIRGHDFVSPGRKYDPGKNFDWSLYFEQLTNKLKRK